MSERDAPSVEPDPELVFWLTPDGTKTANIPLSALSKLLAPHGLAIIPAGDVPSAEDKRVLEANAALDADWLDRCKFSRDVRLFKFAEAELARRAAKGKPGG